MKCPGGHHHVRIEGQLTKPSATYVDGLGKYVADAFHRAIHRQRRIAADDYRVAGLESVIANDLMISRDWRTEKTWSWKRTGRRINVLESFSAVGCLELAGLASPDSRLISALDSNVARGALSKGRSSAFSLQPSLKRSCALKLAFGLYPPWIFSPTRLNTADDGSRGKSLRSGTSSSILDFLDARQIKAVQQVGLRRPFSNWLRLILLAQLCLSSEGFSVGSGESYAAFGSLSLALLPLPFCALALSLLWLSLAAPSAF